VVGGAVVGGAVVGGSVVGGGGGSVVGGGTSVVSTARVVSTIKVVSTAWPTGPGSSAPAPTWSSSTQTNAMTAALTALFKDDLCTMCTPRRLDHATR
jgi:hypothetical protein